MNERYLPQMPAMSVCMEAAASGTPVTLDGMDVVVHEVVALVPATLVPHANGDDGPVRRQPPARA
jgi:hypothetical protein